MQPLDYQTPRPRPATSSPAFWAAPAVGAVATLVAAGHSLAEEPFGVFTVVDASVQVGSPLVAVGLWLYWCAAARRERLSAGVVLPALAWAGLHLTFALWLGIGYFHEPWAR